MSDSEARLEFVGQLGEEFVARFRRGERPAVSEYTDRHPQFANEIREIFPALLVMEDVAPAGVQGVVQKVGEDHVRDTISRLGDYRIIREVGRGGMGIVYEAEQESLGRHVALKVLPQNLLTDDRRNQRFEREAKAAGRLHHTNIVPVFGVGEQAGLSYYVMQFIPGLGLDAVLDELKRLKAAKKSTSRLASGDEELLVSRRLNVAAADVARSLFDGTIVPHSSAINASPVPMKSATDLADSPTIESTAADPGASAACRDEAFPCTRPSSCLVAGRTETATGKLSDTFALSGSLGPPGNPTGPEAGAQRHRRDYWHSVAHIGVQVASALHYAHDQGILHRDIKPGNLLLDLQGAVWVTDFGLAKSSDQADITHSGDVLGTLRYMPPEAFEGKMDARSDVYSLGLTLYELLALKPAFDDRDRQKLIRQVTTTEAPSLESLNPEIPRDLATIVHKAIDRDSARRYQTALDLQLDLTRFVADEPVQARPLTWRERSWRWCRHNRIVAMLSSVLIVALTTVALGSTFAYFREFAHRREIEYKNTAIIAALGRAEAAQAAEAQAKDDAMRTLYRSLVDQARANRLSRRIGQRLGSLELLAKATRMARELALTENDYLELRSEAVACFVLPDFKISPKGHPSPNGGRGIDFTAALDRFARADREGAASIHRTSDDAQIWSVSGAEPGTGPGDYVPLFSPDGRFLAVWLLDRAGAIRVWRLDGPQPILILNEEGSHRPAFSPDNRRLAYRDVAGSIVVVDLDSGPRLRKFPVGNHPGFLAWHPAGRLLAIGTTRGVEIRDADSGSLNVELPSPGGTFSVAWHPDGRTLASEGLDLVIQIWDVASHKPTVQLKGHKNGGIRFTFSHDGNWLASTGWEQGLWLWDPRTGELIFRLPVAMSGLAFSADDRWLAASVSETTRQLSLVEVVPPCGYRTLVRDPASGKGVYLSSSVSPDDRLLAAAMTDGVAVWDLASGRALTFLACGSCWSVLFEPQPSGGLLTAEAAGVFRRPIDGDAAATGILRFGAPQKLPLPGELGQIAMSGDGRVVAKSIYSGGVVWRPARTEPPISLHFHEDARYIAVSPDGRHVATGSHSDAGVVIWDALTGKLVQTLPAMSARVAKVEFSSNGRWLAASDGGLWETVSWTLARRFDPCFGIAFSPDSKILAMKDHLGVASLVDPETGRVYARLEDPHADRAECLCFSPSGKQLIATRTDSSTVQMWDLRVIREELARIGLDWDLPPYR